MRLIPSRPPGWEVRRDHSPVVALIVVALFAATAAVMVRMDGGQARPIPQSHPNCVAVVATAPAP